MAAIPGVLPDWDYRYREIEDRGQDNYAIKRDQGGTRTGTLAMPLRRPDNKQRCADSCRSY